MTEAKSFTQKLLKKSNKLSFNNICIMLKSHKLLNNHCQHQRELMISMQKYRRSLGLMCHPEGRGNEAHRDRKDEARWWWMRTTLTKRLIRARYSTLTVQCWKSSSSSVKLSWFHKKQSCVETSSLPRSNMRSWWPCACLSQTPSSFTLTGLTPREFKSIITTNWECWKRLQATKTWRKRTTRYWGRTSLTSTSLCLGSADHGSQWVW